MKKKKTWCVLEDMQFLKACNSVVIDITIFDYWLRTSRLTS